jgi:2-keto-4-pentenoate hydratase/2-oxohepta-3-ene-1,7-dioic acid hydratase in catechol pathway
MRRITKIAFSGAGWTFSIGGALSHFSALGKALMSLASSPPFALGTFATAGGPTFAGLTVAGRVIALGAANGFLKRQDLGLMGTESVLAILQTWDHNLPALHRVAAALAGGLERDLETLSVPVSTLTTLAPVNLPRQIFCSGANYKKHVVDIIVAQAREETLDMTAEERRAYGVRKMDERATRGTPFFFCKAQSAVTGPHDPIVIPSDVRQPDWELELGVVIGRPARRVSRAQALSHVAGYTIVNDITTRERVNRKEGDMKELGMDWVASKSSPTFLPMGPYLVPASFVPDPQRLQIVLKLNGQTMQDESTADMIFNVARLIEALSVSCLLQPGDVICTGSPAGNGMHYGRFLRPGDIVEGSITGLGEQRNPCIAEEQRCLPGELASTDGPCREDRS